MRFVLGMTSLISSTRLPMKSGESLDTPVTLLPGCDKAANEASLNGIAHAGEHDRDRAGGLFGGYRCPSAGYNDDINFEPDKVRGKLG